MNTFLTYSLILCLLCINAQASQKNPEERFKERYANALTFFERHQKHINNIADFYQCDRRLVYAIVFPELIRYNMWKDMLETKSNELLYASEGRPRSYFSIGYFQIKPIFAEKIELVITHDNFLSVQFNNLIAYHASTASGIRKERIDRLKSYKWQTRYVCAFIKIVEKKFPETQHFSIEEKIAFFATAYNHSYEKPINHILAWQEKKTFPYGMNRENPYAYAEVSLFFFLHHFDKIIR